MKKPSKLPALSASPTPANIFELDPNQHRVRMYHEITELYDRLARSRENLTVMEHTKILATINTIEKPAVIIKAEPDGERTGTVVSKYKGAFTAKSDAASRRKANAGPAAPEPESDDWFESADRAEDDGESDSDDAA